MAQGSEEQWRPVVGYEGFYEVSDLGRVRTLHPNFYGRIRKPESHRQGYLAVKLYRDGVRAALLIHRLVAEAFCEQREGMDIVRHLDGDKHHNRPSNLAWGDHHENRLDAIRHGHDRNARKTHCKHGHAFDEVNTGHRIRHGRTWRICRECVRLSNSKQSRGSTTRAA